MFILLFLIPLIMLIIITWLSYFLSDRICASMQKESNSAAKGARMLWFILIFVILFILAGWFYVNNLTLHR